MEPIKTLETPGWVTSISFGVDNKLAIRSDRSCVSILDLSPMGMTSTRLSSALSNDSAYYVAWSPNGALLARIMGNVIAITDTEDDECTQVAAHGLRCNATAVEFRPNNSEDKFHLAVTDVEGNLTILEIMQQPQGNSVSMRILQSVAVDTSALTAIA